LRSGLNGAGAVVAKASRGGPPSTLHGCRGAALQFFQHLLGEALAIGATVKELQGGDLGAVLLDELAEGADQGFGLLLATASKPCSMT